MQHMHRTRLKRVSLELFVFPVKSTLVSESGGFKAKELSQRFRNLEAN